MQGISLACTTTSEYMFTSTQQVSARLWRHLHPIHIDAAPISLLDLDSSSSSGASVQPGGPTTNLLSTFSRNALLLALAQHTMLKLVDQGVPEIRVRVHEIGAASEVGWGGWGGEGRGGRGFFQGMGGGGQAPP